MRDLLKNGSAFFTRKQNNILSAAFVIMVTYGLSNIVGLLKTRLLISYFFDTAGLLDVYYAAFVIPDTIFQLLVIGSLSAAFIPVFSRLLVKKESEAWYVASVSLNLVVFLLAGISLLIFWQAPSLSRLIAPGFTGEQITIMSTLLRILLISQIFFSVSGFLTGIIQSHQRFLIPALAPLFYNFGIVLGTIILTPSLGIYAPAIGVVIGSVLHVAIQLPLARHLGFKFTFKLDISHTSVKEIVKLVPPRALALGIDQIEQFVSVVLASLLSAGSLSLLNVSRLLYTIPSTLFGVSIGQAALPALSRESSLEDKDKFYHTFSSALIQVAFLALPVSTLFIVLRIPIVRLVFGSSSFPWTATLLTAKALAILALSSTFAAIMHLVIRGFYALHNTKTPLIVGFAAA
ncbi:MAG: murein biosynthesis integral membrane protein MurJ, partial [Patescibacteria group bacterium]